MTVQSSTYGCKTYFRKVFTFLPRCMRILSVCPSVRLSNACISQNG